MEQYVFETGDDTSKLAMDFCDWLETADDEKIPVLEAFRKVPGGFTFGQGSFSFNAPAAPFVIELTYALRKLWRRHTGCIEILVKGYADGQRGPWQRFLLGEPY